VDVKSMSVGTEKMPVRSYLTPKEREEIRDKFIAEQISLSSIQEELEGVKAEFKATMDPIKLEQKDRLALLKAGYREEVQDCYLIPDYDRNEMVYYNEGSEEVSRRKLRPEERQMNILPLTGTGK
jgi:hypothetical protein